MILSRYLKIYPDKENPDHLLLFSTKTTAKILIPKEVLASAEQGTLSGENEKILADLGMIVRDPEEEKKQVLDFIDAVNRTNAVLNLTVILNLDCNFDCVYCYEGDMKGNLFMSPKTADQVVSFIRQQFTDQKKSLVIDFYGGEPLLSLRLIKSMSQALKPIIEERDAAYGFTLVTNGSLLTRKVAEELVPLGLKSAQITLDGPAENHNQYRPFKSGKGSFETVVQNIRETCDLLKINLGGNFDRENYQQFAALLDYFGRIGLTPDKIGGIKFSPILQTSPQNQAPVEYSGGCVSVNEPWLIEAERHLRGKILKRGYNTPKTGPIICSIEMKDAFVVNYDGRIYKCPAFVGRDGFEIGDVETGISENLGPYHLDNWMNEECEACEYLPLCFGGCRYMTLIRDDSLDHLDCKKTYLDSALENLVKQDIQYLSGE